MRTLALLMVVTLWTSVAQAQDCENRRCYSRPTIRSYTQSQPYESTEMLERRLAGRNGRGIVQGWSVKRQNGEWTSWKPGHEIQRWDERRQAWLPKGSSWGSNLTPAEQSLQREVQAQRREIENLKYKLRHSGNHSSPAFNAEPRRQMQTIRVSSSADRTRAELRLLSREIADTLAVVQELDMRIAKLERLE